MSRESVTASAASVNIHATDMSDQKRPYRKTRRAELEEQTRRRITESTVALHEELGPARTSISAIAERAGVRRSTVYRHFPDEEALFAACSSHWRAANPPPDPGAWAAIEDPAERTEAALRELYAFYGRTEAMYDEPPARRAARPDRPAPAARLLRLPARDPGRPDGRPRPARARGAPDARGDRPRARVPDLALADPRAAAGRRRRRRADVPARRGRRSRSPRS